MLALAAAVFFGCPYFSNGVFTQDVRTRAVASGSAEEIAATAAAGGGGSFHLWTPPAERINVAAATTALVDVHPAVRWHRPYSPIPWDPSFYTESLADHHAMIVQPASCRYYESYGTRYAGGVLTEYNGAVWNLRGPFRRAASGALSSASGLPIGLLAVRPEELAAGAIDHALGWGAVAHTVSQDACVSPAARTHCTDDLAYRGPPEQARSAMPYGAHIRLKANVDLSGFPREARIVALALQTYGAFLYDTGCCNEIPAVDDADGPLVWTRRDEAAIERLTLADFDVVAPPRERP